MDGAPDEQRVRAALAAVLDPEIRRPITELGMVGAVATAPGLVEVTVLLTTSACPLRDTLTDDVRAAVVALAPGAEVRVHLGVMDAEQRAALRSARLGEVAVEGSVGMSVGKGEGFTPEQPRSVLMTPRAAPLAGRPPTCTRLVVRRADSALRATLGGARRGGLAPVLESETGVAGIRVVGPEDT